MVGSRVQDENVADKRTMSLRLVCPWRNHHFDKGSLVSTVALVQDDRRRPLHEAPPREPEDRFRLHHRTTKRANAQPATIWVA